MRELTKLRNVDHAFHVGLLENLTLLSCQAPSRVKPLGPRRGRPVPVVPVLVELLAREGGMVVLMRRVGAS